MEKAGYATFKVRDAVSKKITINNSRHFKKNKWHSNLISFGICSLPP
jgi:hypothetical protein